MDKGKFEPENVTDENLNAGSHSQFIDVDFLTIQCVSRLLRCSVDHIYRIPDDQLPVYRPGKRNLYLRLDVIRYLKLHCRVQPRPALDRLVKEIEIDVLESRLDGARERSSRRTQ